MVCYHSRDLVFNPVPEGFYLWFTHPICAVDACQFGRFWFSLILARDSFVPGVFCDDQTKGHGCFPSTIAVAKQLQTFLPTSPPTCICMTIYFSSVVGNFIASYSILHGRIKGKKCAFVSYSTVKVWRVKIYIAQEVNKLTVNRILESALDCLHSCTMTMRNQLVIQK